MIEVRIPVHEELLLTSGRSVPELERELRIILAAKLFELRRVSLGQAAEMCSMSRLRFMDELAQLRIPLINLDDDQILDELHDA